MWEHPGISSYSLEGKGTGDATNVGVEVGEAPDTDIMLIVYKKGMNVKARIIRITSRIQTATCYSKVCVT